MSVVLHASYEYGSMIKILNVSIQAAKSHNRGETGYAPETTVECFLLLLKCQRLF